MDIKEIKRLAQEKSAAELEKLAVAFEESGELPAGVDTEPEVYLSALLQACEVRKLVDGGLSLGDAVREFSKRVRSSIS